MQLGVHAVLNYRNIRLEYFGIALFLPSVIFDSLKVPCPCDQHHGSWYYCTQGQSSSRMFISPQASQISYNFTSYSFVPFQVSKLPSKELSNPTFLIFFMGPWFKGICLNCCAILITSLIFRLRTELFCNTYCSY